MTMAGHSSILVQEERKELMISTGGSPFLRLAHFLTPSHNYHNSIPIDSNGDAFHLPPKPASFSNPSCTIQEPLININFRRWHNPTRDWKEWVDLMYSKHQMLWKKAGIFEAVLNSKYAILRDDELLHVFASMWCSETNTFVFPWGEATLTLEDMMKLGGYSVLGDPVFSPLGTQKMEGIERNLEDARLELSKSKSKKASHRAWLGKFMDSGNEIEHEAFLVYWLSIFVFPLAAESIVKCVFPIAIHLAKGTNIALAPAVLASIYSDLNRYKKAALTSARLTGSKYQNHIEDVLVSSPFNLIQIWVWERFPLLRPNPKNVSPEEPTFATWHDLRRNRNVIVTNSVDKAADSFQWRPYTNTTVGERKIKGGQERCLPVTLGSDEEMEAMIRCLRVSELVGIDNCIEQYLPHRVARQFGFDQDIPAVVEPSDSDQHLAWKSYNRPINDRKLCIPSGLAETNVTVRYLEWWENSMSAQDVDCETFVDGMTSKGVKKQKLLDSARMNPEGEVCDAPTGTTCNALNEKGSGDKEAVKDYFTNSNIGESDINDDLKHSRVFGNGVSYKRLVKGMSLKSSASKKSDDIDASVPPGYLSKSNTCIAGRWPDAKDDAKNTAKEAISISKAFVEKESSDGKQNEAKSIPYLSKASLSELGARIFNIETILAKYKRDRGLA